MFSFTLTTYRTFNHKSLSTLKIQDLFAVSSIILYLLLGLFVDTKIKFSRYNYIIIGTTHKNIMQNFVTTIKYRSTKENERSKQQKDAEISKQDN